MYDYAGNKIAGDNEKDVNSHIAPAKDCKSRMKQNDRNNGKGPQAVYFRSILHNTSKVSLVGYTKAALKLQLCHISMGYTMTWGSKQEWVGNKTWSRGSVRTS